MGKCIEKAFRELHRGTLFYLWSEYVFGARSPQWILCEKISDDTAQELQGCLFHLNPLHEVYVITEEL